MAKDPLFHGKRNAGIRRGKRVLYEHCVKEWRYARHTFDQ